MCIAPGKTENGLEGPPPQEVSHAQGVERSECLCCLRSRGSRRRCSGPVDSRSTQEANGGDSPRLSGRVASTSSGKDSVRLGASEPSLGAIMAAISDLKSTLEPKLDTVTADVSLLLADLQKMADKMSTAESDIQVDTYVNLQELGRTSANPDCQASNNGSQAGGPGRQRKTEKYQSSRGPGRT
ncbi:hypothetical protein NDU88_001055 [Pleurodeles waltl]|uniref:Uncharacterized protein n=1 Tax=Pleurodeles waltl TaxID=8319 RepID=A0AAV7L8F9_PLEWA|nr:hypothetical protein NDU88_001055 [Pleurodeles waltl]